MFQITIDIKEHTGIGSGVCSGE